MQSARPSDICSFQNEKALVGSCFSLLRAHQCEKADRNIILHITYMLLFDLTLSDVLSSYFQDTESSAAVEKTNNLFDAESPMFKKAIYTCIGLVALLTICGLIWEFAYWRPRQPKEAKTGE